MQNLELITTKELKLLMLNLKIGLNLKGFSRSCSKYPARRTNKNAEMLSPEFASRTIGKY